MGSNLFLWIEAVFAFFLFLLMVIDHKRNGEKIFKSLAIVFLFIFLKSIVYMFINLTDVKWMMGINRGQLTYLQPIETLLAPVYGFKNFVVQVLDLLVVVMIAFTFIIRRKEAEFEGKKTGARTMLIIHLIIVVLLGGVVSVLSITANTRIIVKDTVKEGILQKYIDNANYRGQKVEADVKNYLEREMISPDEETGEFDGIPEEVMSVLEESTGLFKTGECQYIEDGVLYSYYMYNTFNHPAIAFFKTNIFFGILIGWKFLLLILALSSVVSIGGYLANLMQYIAAGKSVIIAYFVFQAIYLLFSLMVFRVPSALLLEILAIVLFGLFAVRCHNQYVDNVEEQVENRTREKEIIIELMREISAIIGSGEFELDTVIKQIVDASVKGAENARGGTILLKDPITNRLVVNYVNGLYPPTKPFKTVSGMALNESVLVEKFRSEKIAVGEGLLGHVAETGDPIYIPECLKDESYIQTIRETMTVRSFIAVPLKSTDEVFGVLSVVHDELAFLDSDLSLIETLGEQAAITIKQIQMYQEILKKKQDEKEIGVAGEIQASLVPHTFPETNKYEMYAFSIPAKGVGGDYYDYVDFGGNKLAVTMFDVSGKGVPAALIMVMIRSILRTIASLEEDTKEILTKLNNTISEEIVEDRYATGFYLLFDAEKGIMSYTNAGHGPLVLYRSKSDEFELLDTDGMPVGIMTGVEYGQDYTTLEKGDIAMLYTDGITEAMNEQHEEFGLERVYEIIRGYKREPAREIANKILEDVNKFVGSAPQHDDETLLIFKMK